MRRISAFTALAVLLTAAPAFGFENELLGKRDVDVPGYKSEQGAVLFDEKGNETEFTIDYGVYKKNSVILLLRDTGAKTRTENRVNEIVQVVRAPKPKGLDFYSVGCYLQPGPDAPPGEYVFAYALFGQGEKPMSIKGAWAFDWQAKKIVGIAEAKIDCREPGG
jgi:maltose-binding protein MalE